MWCYSKRSSSIGSWKEATLSKAKKSYFCVDNDEAGEWDDDESICFTHIKTIQYIMYMERHQVELLMDAALAEVVKLANEARSRAFKYFNVKR